MNAVEVYTRAKLLAADAHIATVCEQLEKLCVAVGLADAPNPLPVHKLLCTEAPTPQSRDMHTALTLLLGQVDSELAPNLSVEHAQLWAAIARHFTSVGVRQASMQFQVETEALLAVLAKKLNDIHTHANTWRKALEQTLDATTSKEDMLFWEHEIRAFNRSMS